MEVLMADIESKQRLIAKLNAELDQRSAVLGRIGEEVGFYSKENDHLAVCAVCC